VRRQTSTRACPGAGEFVRRDLLFARAGADGRPVPSAELEVDLELQVVSLTSRWCCPTHRDLSRSLWAARRVVTFGELLIRRGVLRTDLTWSPARGTAGDEGFSRDER
jgi:hypothetical protein